MPTRRSRTQQMVGDPTGFWRAESWLGFRDDTFTIGVVLIRHDQDWVPSCSP